MKTNQNPQIQDMAERHAQQNAIALDDNWSTSQGSEPIAVPNKAQHSPLQQWLYNEAYKHDASTVAIVADLKAHADKLAEALRDCVTSPGALAERSHEYALRRLDSITRTANEALAYYKTKGGAQ